MTEWSARLPDENESRAIELDRIVRERIALARTGVTRVDTDGQSGFLGSTSGLLGDSPLRELLQMLLDEFAIISRDRIIALSQLYLGEIPSNVVGSDSTYSDVSIPDELYIEESLTIEDYKSRRVRMRMEHIPWNGTREQLNIVFRFLMNEQAIFRDQFDAFDTSIVPHFRIGSPRPNSVAEHKIVWRFETIKLMALFRALIPLKLMRAEKPAVFAQWACVHFEGIDGELSLGTLEKYASETSTIFTKIAEHRKDFLTKLKPHLPTRPA